MSVAILLREEIACVPVADVKGFSANRMLAEILLRTWSFSDRSRRRSRVLRLSASRAVVQDEFYDDCFRNTYPFVDCFA